MIYLIVGVGCLILGMIIQGINNVKIDDYLTPHELYKNAMLEARLARIECKLSYLEQRKKLER